MPESPSSLASPLPLLGSSLGHFLFNPSRPSPPRSTMCPTGPSAPSQLPPAEALPAGLLAGKHSGLCSWPHQGYRCAFAFSPCTFVVYYCLFFFFFSPANVAMPLPLQGLAGLQVPPCPSSPSPGEQNPSLLPQPPSPGAHFGKSDPQDTALVSDLMVMWPCGSQLCLQHPNQCLENKLTSEPSV